jgi:hypothetical protein
VSDHPCMQVTVDGVEYRMESADFSAEDDLAVYRATGMTLMDIFSGSITLFTVAALVWRYRVRNGEPTLQLGEVLPHVKLLELETLKFTKDEGASPEGGAPKPRARRS